MKDIIEFALPNKAWFTLREVCELKGICYKTICNRTALQPNKGKEDGRIGGRKAFRWETIKNWIDQTDSEILEGGKK